MADSEWALFADWCAATNRQPRYATRWDLMAFADDLSCSSATVQRLLRVITRQVMPPAPRERPCAPAWDTNSALLSTGESIRRCPSAGFPEAYRGRRDAWLLVLMSPPDDGGLGLSRFAAVNLRPSNVPTNISTHDDPGRCPRCVAVRWQHVVGLEHRWSRSAVRSHLATVSPFPRHVCDRVPDDAWLTAWTLAPAIDQHGWATTWRPMTPRAVTEVLRRRRDPAAPLVSLPAISAPQTAHAVRDPDAKTLTNLEDVAKRADEVNSRVAALLDDTDGLLRRTRR